MILEYLLLKNLSTYILISNVLIISGIISVIFAQNAITWLLSVELIFLGSIINFLVFSIFYYNPEGYIYTLIILILVAAESAVGLTLIIYYFTLKKNINIETYTNIKI